MKLHRLATLAASVLVCGQLCAAVVATNVRIGPTYTGACDASGAAVIDDRRFVMASDEMDSPDDLNRLHVYDDGAARPILDVDLTPAVQHPPTHDERDNRENDIEGAARIGNRIFWITSHGPNSTGKKRPDRYRFFATDVTTANTQPLRLAGAEAPHPAYVGLFNDLAADTRLAPLNIKSLEKTAPEEGGLNIEGLCATRDGGLMIALRSPLTKDDQAVLVPLINASELIAGTASKATLGDPIMLDLGKRGIRDIVFWEARNLYVIIAGSPKAADDFALYTWTIGAAPAKLLDASGREVMISGLRPESLVLRASGELLVLSDDGDALIAGIKLNKDVASDHRTFRSLSMRLEVQP